MQPLTSEQARALDRRAIDVLGVPGVVLMENAGRNMAHLLASLGVAGPVVVCCGKGNNGGDGYVIARHLAVLGLDARAVALADPAGLAGDAALAFGALKGCGLSLEVSPDEGRLRELLASADWVVDALLGSGLTGPVRPEMAAVIGSINASGKRVLAVDVPSGLDADTGRPRGAAVRAAHTAAVVGPRVGFATEQGRAHVGRVHVVDFGVPARLLAGA